MNNEIKKSLQLTCPTCSSVFQLLEIQHQSNLEVIHNSYDNCQRTWTKLLNQHYQEQIILNLAQQEAQKEEHD